MGDIVKEAGERYRDAVEALRDQRDQIAQDLKFSDPANPEQWDEQEKLQRLTDPGGARPCLVMDQCGQYVSNVAGATEQQPPSLHAIPVGDGADRKVAEHLDGIFRHIEHTSRAAQHYARALTSSARVGVGYLIVRPEFTDRALGYQEPRISSEGDPLRVVRDPWSVELDGSDATFGQIITPFSFPEFERKFGAKAKKVDFGDDEHKSKTDDREQVLTAEEWRIIDTTSDVVVCKDAQGLESSMPKDQFAEAKDRDGLTLVRTYKDKVRTVKWVRMSGDAVLSEEIEYPASGVGIVPVYGYVGWSDGRMTYCGIPRRARQPQRAYNYHISEIRAYMSQAPKAPLVVSVRAIRGLEHLYDRAAVDSKAFLPYNDIDESGVPIPEPKRASVAIDLQNHIQAADAAKADIQAAIGMYQANLGAPSNETSGVAIQNRKEQGEASTAHFPQHLAAALGQVGKLCMEMIPRLIDSRRQQRIIGIDQTPSVITVDPKQKDALAETPEGLSINPNVGKYDVRVIVGASFSTQRQQAQEAYTEMMRANPQMMPAIAPLWAQTLDVPHADKLAQVLTAMAPPAVQAILQPEQQQGTAALQQQVDQLKQALQQAIAVAHDAQQECDQLHQQMQSKAEETAIKEYDAVTRRLAATAKVLQPPDVQLANDQELQSMQQHPDPAPQAQPQQVQ